MALLSVTIRDYVINIVMTHECAHQDAHYQVAVVMMRSKTDSRYKSICSRSMVEQMILWIIECQSGILFYL